MAWGIPFRLENSNMFLAKTGYIIEKTLKNAQSLPEN